MSANKCAACPEKLYVKDTLSCSLCKDCYHFQCVNINLRDFKKLPESFKKTWLCPSCVIKQPKCGDNSNTPIGKRSTPTAGEKHDYDNVAAKPPDEQLLAGTSFRQLNDLLDSKFATLKLCLMSELKTITDNLKLEFNAAVEFLATDIAELRKDLQSANEFIVELQARNTTLRSDTSNLTARLDLLEQYNRERNIVIDCVPERRTENIPQLVKKLAAVVSYDIPDIKLTTCYRVEKLNKQSARPRAIIVKLPSSGCRDDFLAAVKIFNRNSTDKLHSTHLALDSERHPIYVGEHLSASNRALHAATRKTVREKDYKYCWIRGGRIFVRKNDTCPSIVIRSLDSLKLLV